MGRHDRGHDYGRWQRRYARAWRHIQRAQRHWLEIQAQMEAWERRAGGAGGGGAEDGAAGPGPESEPITGSPNPIRLCRPYGDRRIFGVCAGLAAYFGVSTWHVRAGAIVAAVFMPPWAFFGYLIATIFMPPCGQRVPVSADETRFWRSVTDRPRQTTGDLRHRFRELEARLATMERHVTTEEFRLNRAFRDLDGSGASPNSPPEKGED